MSNEFDLAINGYLAEGSALSEKVAQAIEELKGAASGRPIVLYGRLSPVSVSMIEILAEFGLQPAGFCAIDGKGENFDGLPVVDFQTLKKDYSDAVIIVCSSGITDETTENLAKIGFLPEHVFSWDWSHTTILNRVRALSSQSFPRHIAKYSWAFEFFEDEISKQTILARVRMYLCNVPMQVNTRCAQYFEENCITLGDGEIFVDGGAHQGESAFAFIKAVEAARLTYAHVYSFEPDSVNYPLVVQNTSGFPRVTVVPKGLWSSETELTFFEKGDTLGSSFVNLPDMSMAGTMVSKVPVTSLDTFFEGKPENELPTFIKMDIEGAEKEALIGARGIISSVKPKLAICAYHKPEDVYALPQTIMRIRDDYRFALRQYMAGQFETVLYAY
jgi:FkbM family methyltransferase